MLRNKIKKFIPTFIINYIILIINYIKKWKSRPIENFFKTNYNNNVLISYIIRPFKNTKGFYKHTNNAESLVLANIFKNLGFNVDVFNYDYKKNINYDKYNLIIGFGEPLINSFYQRKKNIVTVYYGTGMHVCMQNHNTLNRIKEVYQKKGIWMPESGRIVEKAWSIQTSIVDAIITFGNEKVLNSYKKYFDKMIYNTSVSYYEIFSDENIIEVIKNKNFNEAKYNFIWFGSSGMIHKGLDLLLEVFSEQKESHLHVCGPIKKEKKFEHIYYKELYDNDNIHTYGYVDLQSNLFSNLVKKCAFVIFPSCSEGEPSSVINLMANGIIPIVTRESGIKIKKFGFLINAISTNAIQQTMQSVVLLSNRELIDRTTECFQDTRECHSIKKFEETLSLVLREIIQNEM